jgi:hypothetical protein
MLRFIFSLCILSLSVVACGCSASRPCHAIEGFNPPPEVSIGVDGNPCDD